MFEVATDPRYEPLHSDPRFEALVSGMGSRSGAPAPQGLSPLEENLTRDILEARARALDDARPEAVARVHADGQLTARERLASLLDYRHMVLHLVLRHGIPEHRRVNPPPCPSIMIRP